MAEDPHESPKATPHPVNDWRGSRTWRITVGVVLAVLSLPAAGIAFFCCCLMGFSDRNGDTGVAVGLALGSIGGLAVFALMVWGAVVWLRVPRQPK